MIRLSINGGQLEASFTRGEAVPEDDPSAPPQDVLDAFAKDCRNGCGICHGGRPCDGCMAGGVCDRFACECDEQPFGEDDDCERDEWPG